MRCWDREWCARALLGSAADLHVAKTERFRGASAERRPCGGREIPIQHAEGDEREKKVVAAKTVLSAEAEGATCEGRAQIVG